MKVFEKKKIYSAWLAVDDNGTEKKYFAPPKRNLKHHEWWGVRARLSKGSIKKLIGRKLTWKDEPLEINFKINNGYEQYIYRNLRPCIVTRGEILYGSTNKQR